MQAQRFALLFFLLVPCALAQTPPAAEYEPQLWQAGKDVVWVPMADDLVARMLDLAKVTAEDFVMDLGSGDGRTVIAAAKRGAHSLGVEFNPDLVAYSRRAAERAGVADRAEFVQGDLFQADLSRATVITLFLLEDINLKLRPHLLALKPGTRVLSNTFRMGDWQPDAQATYPGQSCSNWCALFLWIVPARVQGAWRTPQGELQLEQRYQMVAGKLGTGVLAAAISEGKLVGDQIRFVAGGAEYRGRVRGDAIEGMVDTGSGLRPWRAERPTR
jgi:hypothetical protein